MTTELSMAEALGVDLSKYKSSILEHTRYVYNYEPADHHKDWFTALEDDSILRLIIVGAPKYGKTPTMGDYVSYRIGEDSNYKCLYLSNTASQAYKPSISIRDTIENNKRYKKLYNLELDREKGWSVGAWYVKRKGYDKDPTFQACGIFGPVLGATVNEIILDDVADQENMATEYQRQKLMEWLRVTAFSRLIPGGRIIMICTRWHEDDPVAHFEKEGWTVIKLPTYTIDDDEAWYHDENEDKWKLTQAGINSLTYPQYRTPKDIEQARVDLGLLKFVLMFQCRVMPSEGGIFKKQWWRYYDEPPRRPQIVAVWDTAFEEKKSSSYSACEIWYMVGNGYYLIDVWRAKMSFPELKAVFNSIYDQYLPHVVLLEKKASGHALYQELVASSTIPVVPIVPTKDKVARANAVTPIIEAGKVYLPRDEYWLQDWQAEHEMFPNAAHDDWVDCTTMFLNWARIAGVSEVDEPISIERESIWR